jgi:hypothetical protein
MRDVTKLAALAFGGVGAFVSGAQATPVEKCYNLEPFTDVLKLVFQDPVDGHQLVYGIWIEPGVFTIPVSGAREDDLGGASKRLGLTGTIRTPTGFRNLIAGFDGTIGGAFEVEFVGPDPATNNLGSPLTKISCTGISASMPRKAGRTALGK